MSNFDPRRERRGFARRGLIRRAVVAAGAAVVLLGAEVWAAGPAAAIPGPAVLYAYAAGAAVSPTSCPQDTTGTPANECSLAEALNLANPGDTIDLATPGGTAHYVGNWTVTTNFTANTTPVTIQPAPGVSNPTLDGNGPGTETCSTSSCAGPVLTVKAGQFVALSGITISNANNTSGPGTGGGLDNAGTVTITGSTFTGNHALNEGGAIDNGDGSGLGGTGSVTVTGSTFTGNTANEAGAIDNGDRGGGGTVTVTASTFTNNTAASGFDGGAIDNGDNHGSGTLTVTNSTFTGNTASDGGAIDNGDFSGSGTATVTSSTFTSNTTSADGGAIDSADNGGTGSLTVTASTFSKNTTGSFGHGAAIDSGDNGGAGKVTVTASTFTSNNTNGGAGGAIDSGNNGGGSVQVTASTFASNTAGNGGAIDSGDHGGGSVQVTASTFTGNTAQVGGAIDSGDDVGAGTMQVTASTFTGNTATTDGNTIDNSGTGTVQVAGDLFNGSCNQAAGTWTDGGYNAGTDKTCFASPTPATGDKSDPAVGSDLQTALTGNGGPTQTIAPTTGNPAIALIPDPATITLGSNQVALCPATDQRGYPSAASTACDAGAVQTSGWPAQVTGTHRPAAHAAEGYRLGVAGNTWKLYVTHPGTAKVSFTGKVSVPAGTLGHLSLINPTTGHQVTGTGKAITFTLPDSGTVTGFSFTTTATVAKITFTLDIGGHPATPSQIFLGGKATHPATGSPLTFIR